MCGIDLTSSIQLNQVDSLLMLHFQQSMLMPSCSFPERAAEHPMPVRGSGRGKAMHKGTPLLQWQIVEKHEEWEAALRPPAVDMMPNTVAGQRRPYRRYIWGGLMMLLATTGVWLWQTAQAGLDQIEGELSGTVQAELAFVAQGIAPLAASWSAESASLAWQDQLAREQNTLHTLLSPDIPLDQLTTNVKTINLQGDRAVAEFVTTAQDGTQPYGQTRFYRQTAEGWQRTMPDANLWGAPRSLQSSHFIFNFRQNDAQVVDAVAPQIDALYTELQRHFGLTPSIEKLVIEVTVERITDAIPTPRWALEPLVVPSPALYLAPVEMSDSAILAQSIALPLIEYVGEQAVKAHAIPSRWRPLLDGLHLWQLWDVDMPLAHWRHDVVTWFYIDLPVADPERQVVLPDTYAELCAMHSLWMVAPTLVRIPVECTAQERVTWSQRRWVSFLPHTRLDQLSMPRIGYDQFYDEENYFHRSSEAVKGAILVEYAVAVYGYEQLPVLLAGLAQHDTWDTLLPAVYGVSSSEFEKGWQAYLVEEYGLEPNLLRP
jgi:hypothetical protein